MAGAVLAAGGLAGFLVFASPRGGNGVPATANWLGSAWPASSSSPSEWLAAQRGPAGGGRPPSAWAGGRLAFTAALTKVVTNYATNDWVSMFRHWQTYALAVFGLVAVFLTTNAYHAGPVAASQSAIVLIDPLASILIGVSLFGENLRTAGAWGPLEALSLLVLFVGAIILCTSPLLNPTKVGGAESANPLHPYRSGRGPDAGEAVPPSRASRSGTAGPSRLCSMAEGEGGQGGGHRHRHHHQPEPRVAADRGAGPHRARRLQPDHGREGAGHRQVGAEVEADQEGPRVGGGPGRQQ